LVAMSASGSKELNIDVTQKTNPDLLKKFVTSHI
jgi:hypothetical protein